jgi:TolB-like protein/Tfp pilus assembly protein PilF
MRFSIGVACGIRGKELYPMEPRTVRFESFELDLRLRELRAGPKRIRLQEQPFEILRMMVSRPGDVVTREELRQHLWPAGTFVDFEHSLNAAVKRLRSVLGDDAENPRFVETLPRRGYRFIAKVDVHAGDDATGLPEPAKTTGLRLAVLPFSNLSTDPSQEYFSDGLTEEMISQLGRLCRGRVGIIARWSSMAFKGASTRVREIGQALGAQYLLEGSVRGEGDRIRIVARLIDAAAETHLWSETYERNLVDCLSVQTDVATRIAQSLAMELVPEQRAAVRSDVEAAAYQEYLKGRYYWNKTLDDGIDQAITFFERALRVSPSFGAAHASLARVWVGRAEYYHQLPRSALIQADAVAARALAIDPDLYEAHMAHGDVRRMLDGDWSAAETSYRHAIALNPSYEAAYRGLATTLSATGRHAEAIEASERACDLDPLCLVVGTTAAAVRYAAGHFEAAIERCRHTIDMDPEFVGARLSLAASYLQSGRAAEAIAELQSAVMIDDANPVLLCGLANALGVAGSRRDAETLIGRVVALAQERYVASYHLALAYAGVGRIDEAFDALQQAWLDRDPACAMMAVEPRFDPLRDDARFDELIKQVGLSVQGSVARLPDERRA